MDVALIKTTLKKEKMIANGSFVYTWGRYGRTEIEAL